MFSRYIETIQKYVADLQQRQSGDGREVQDSGNVGETVDDGDDELIAALNGLRVIQEEVLTSLEAAEVAQEELLQQNHTLAVKYQHYSDLFQSLPIAYLVTNANGLILEANQAIAELLGVPQPHLLGKPLAVFVDNAERKAFYMALNQLNEQDTQQRWYISLVPRDREAVVAELRVDIARNVSGAVEALWIGVLTPSPQPPTVVQLNEVLPISPAAAEPALPYALDGLQVLFVDDEADAREFVTAVLESHGVKVTAVATVAEALAAVDQLHPDVLISDVRMPDADGYTLIRQVRQMETQWGGHIPAAAFTAYLEENREKAVQAGYEAHLHKLAPPTELVDLVLRLAGRLAT